MTPLTWRRVSPGLYESTNGQHRINRCVLPGEGPKRGTWVEWVELRPDTHPAYVGGWIADGEISPTLRSCKIAIDERLHREGADTRHDRRNCPDCKGSGLVPAGGQWQRMAEAADHILGGGPSVAQKLCGACTVRAPYCRHNTIATTCDRCDISNQTKER